MALEFEDEDSNISLVKDIAPFIVLEDTAMSKLHFLFIMLNIAQVNIINQGAITGIITKLEFLKKRKEEAQIMRKERRRLKVVNYLSSGVSTIGNAIGKLGRSAPKQEALLGAKDEFKQ